MSVQSEPLSASNLAPASAPALNARANLLRARSLRLVLGLLGLGVLLAAWWLGTDVLARPESFAARFSPTAALPALGELLTGSDLPLHVMVSLRRVLVGLAIALALGVPIGILIGTSRFAEAATTPAFQFLRMISPLSWMPVAVMVFGVGDAPIYFLIAFATIWPIMLSTAAGVRALDPQWLLLSRSLAATRWETLSRIVIPGILGHVLTGARLAIGIAWIILVPCEMLGVSAGLGYFILDTRDRLAYPELMATILIIGVIGFALDSLARALVGRFAPGQA
ncbi:ABC transporter permease [Tianweitania populi]|uniref:ABC transporter permease n=1 Tax=Tianweitania populi TaxID=1607949 RepID=A0A8J3GM95_9HYPH|nr:ABC transporter permease [Tianweitania populi]GHD23093.1 ABC transporter permease [Tianweitania populi]